jgi:hypothetical protein
MSPQEINAAIGIACGYRKTQTWRWNQSKTERVYQWVHVDDKSPNPRLRDYPPFYYNNYSDIVGAWETLIKGRDDLEDAYSVNLGLACGCDDPQDGGRPGFCDADLAIIINASVPQRCEALMRTLNL